VKPDERRSRRSREEENACLSRRIKIGEEKATRDPFFHPQRRGVKTNFVLSPYEIGNTIKLCDRKRGGRRREWGFGSNDHGLEKSDSHDHLGGRKTHLRERI